MGKGCVSYMTTGYLQNLFTLAEGMPATSTMLDISGFKLQTMTAAYIDSLRVRNPEWERGYVEFASLREREWFALRATNGSHWPLGRSNLPDDQRSEYLDRLVREFGQPHLLPASVDLSRIGETVDPNDAIYLAQPVKDTNAWRRHLVNIRCRRDTEVDVICESRGCDRDEMLSVGAMLRYLEELASHFSPLQVTTKTGRQASFVVELVIRNDFALQVHWDDPHLFSSRGDIPLSLRSVYMRNQTNGDVRHSGIAVSTTFERLLPGFRHYFEFGCNRKGRFTLAMTGAFAALNLMALSLGRFEC